MKLTTEESNLLKEATRYRVTSLQEARKKLRGNLCILTGKGSGGGFVPCNSGTFGRSDAGSLQTKRSKTALQLRTAITGLRKALREGKPEDIQAHAKTLAALDRGSRIVIVPGAATVDAKFLANAKASTLARLATAYKAISEKRVAEIVKNDRPALLPRPEFLPKKMGDTSMPIDKAAHPSGVTDLMRKALGNKKMANGWEDLATVENRLASGKTEGAAMFDETGAQIMVKRGGKSHVSFTRQEIELMKDATLTHNHPSGHSFSGQDLVLAVRTNAAQIRAVSKFYNEKGAEVGSVAYVFTRPENGWTRGGTVGTPTAATTLARHFTTNHKAYNTAVREQISKGKPIGLPDSVAASIQAMDKTITDAGYKGAFSYEVKGDWMKSGAEVYTANRRPTLAKKQSSAKASGVLDKALAIFRGSGEQGASYEAQYRKEQGTTLHGFPSYRIHSVGGKQFNVNPSGMTHRSKGVAYQLSKSGGRSSYVLLRHPDRPDLMFAVHPRKHDQKTPFDGKFFRVVPNPERPDESTLEMING